jgi:hypothetical protein
MTVPNSDPILMQLRAGTVDDPYVSKADTKKIVDNVVTLDEIPDQFTHVTVNGFTEIYDCAPSEDQFLVNYSNGVVTFNSAKEGTTVTLNYKGRGVNLYPTTRIYVNNGIPDTTTNLQTVLNDMQSDINEPLTLSRILDAGSAASKNVGTNSGEIPVLGTNGKLDSSVLPAIAITTTFVVASETEMLDLNATSGNIAVRTDINNSFILKQTPASVLSNWQQLLSSNAITSVNGKTGVVTLTSSDVGAVPTSRNVAVGSGLTGGGTLGSDVTIGVNFVTSGGNNGTATTVSRGDHTHSDVVASGASGLMSGADKSKLDGIANNANNYIHPSGDGNLHVPVTSTTNNGKFLTAGATAGSLSWTIPPMATQSVNGYLSSVDKTKLDGISVGANKTTSSITNGNVKVDTSEVVVYTHPSVDGNLHVPATGTTNNTKVLKAGSTAGSASWASVDWSELTGKPSTFTPSAHTHPFTDITGSVNASQHGVQNDGTLHAVATGSVNGFMSSADKTKLDGVAANANNYAHPNHTGDVTSTGDGATVIANGVVTLSKMANMATSSIIGRTSSGSGSPEILTPSQVRTMLNVADGATNYVHPTGDGNLHVPATSTTSSTKVLKAGATSGSLSWGFVDWDELTNKPTDVAGYGITDTVSLSDVATVATADKLLKLDNNAKLPASITGDANSVGGQTLDGLDGRYASATHNHDTTYLKLVGGTLTGAITLPNNVALRTTKTDTSTVSLAYLDNTNTAVFGGGSSVPLRFSGSGIVFNDGFNGDKTVFHTGNFDPHNVSLNDPTSSVLTLTQTASDTGSSYPVLRIKMGATPSNPAINVLDANGIDIFNVYSDGSLKTQLLTATYGTFTTGISVNSPVKIGLTLKSTTTSYDLYTDLITPFKASNGVTVHANASDTSILTIKQEADSATAPVAVIKFGDTPTGDALQVRNNTDSPLALINNGGEFEVTTSGNGVIMKTPDGTKRYRISIDNSGALTTALI